MSSRSRETPPDDAHLAAIERAMVAIRRSVGRRRLGARLTAGAAGQPVDLLQLAVLDAVEEGPDPGVRDVTVGAVAQRMGADPSRASRRVAAAMKAGNLVRVASQQDSRRVGLELTASGRALLALVHRTRRRFFGQILADWSPADRGHFARLLTRFTATLQMQSKRPRGD